MNITIPWCPSANSLYRTIVRGRYPTIIISAKGRQFFADIAKQFADDGIQMMDGDLEIWIKATPPDRRKRDLDNLNKAIFDSLSKGGAIFDDSQIKIMHSRMLKPSKPGRVEIRLEQIIYEGTPIDKKIGAIVNKTKREIKGVRLMINEETAEHRATQYKEHAAIEGQRAVQWYDRHQVLEVKLAEAEKALEIEQARAGVLEEALEKYGQHGYYIFENGQEYPCPVKRGVDNSGIRCKCGLDEALCD